jgi:hypothetical protein
MHRSSQIESNQAKSKILEELNIEWKSRSDGKEDGIQGNFDGGETQGVFQRKQRARGSM